MLLSLNSFKKALRVFQINFKLRKTFTSCPKVVPSILKVSPVVFFTFTTLRFKFVKQPLMTIASLVN